MLDRDLTILGLVLFAGAFAVASVLHSRRRRETLEDYIVARNSTGRTATVLTLLASGLGAWIMFGPPSAATWGGTGAVIGYALGAAAPRLAMIPLGRRMRRLIPEGHTLSEYVSARYGRPMYVATLLVMLFYMFIYLAAEVTAMAKLLALIAPVPLWLTAVVTMGATLIYTSYGGLRASIFTDKLQMLVIVPFLGILLWLGWQAAGGTGPTLAGLAERAPHLIDPFNWSGVKAGLTFFLAILLTGLFHQGYWQRVYAARDDRTVLHGFLVAALVTVPVIFAMGLFGLAYVGLGATGDPSTALFAVMLQEVPAWLAIGLILFGLALVMSSADTVISAISSIVAVDLARLTPNADEPARFRMARWLVLLLAVPVCIVAAQGYSVLYMFLLADLLCAAATFPVFFGLFSRRHDGTSGIVAVVAGLIAGFALFPGPSLKGGDLLGSFVLAAVVPAVVCLLAVWLRPARQDFDLDSLRHRIRRIGATG